MQTNGSSILGTIGVLLLVGFFLYLYLGITLMMIAKRSNTSYSGLAFLPIGNLFLMCRLGRRPGWWVLLLLIPVVNVAVFAMIWMSIAEVRGKPVWTGAFAAIPLLGLLVPLYFAIGKTQVPGTVAARICTTCGTPILGVESFCRNCGHAAPPPTLARRASTGKLALIGAVTSVVVVALVGGIAWVTLFRGLSYTPPDRKPPQIPERLAGTMTEFPVDTDTKSDGRMEPGSVITEDLGTGGSTSSSQQVPQKWLPPGVTRSRLPQVAGTMTSAAYRPRRQPGATTENVVDQIYVHVLRALQNQTQQLIDELARSVTQSTGGSRSGVRVQSPGGIVYTGSRIQSPQISVYVLQRQGSDIVILIYGPSPAVQAATARLAGNVGNGQGLNDSPTIQTTVWTLPRQPPTDFVLQSVNTLSGDELFSSADFQSAGNDQQTRELINKVRQFIPERITTARYRDGSRRDWNVYVYDYESTRRAWNTWFFLRWTVGLSGQSVTVAGTDGLYVDTDQGRALVFQKGPYLIAIQGPSGSAVPTLVDLAGRLQV
jgi:hypothetical protein